MLQNPRHEQFSQCMALGHTSASECYVNSGYQQDRNAAEHLAKTAVIAARIREIEMKNNATAIQS